MATKKERWNKLIYINEILPKEFPGTDATKKMDFFATITEEQLSKLEAAHAIMQVEQENAKVVSDRSIEYFDQGLHIKDMIVTLWEAYLSGDNSKVQEFEAKRQAIKAKHPKK